MTYQDIQDALGTLARLSAELEDQYIESEGEVTPEAEALEAEKEAVAHLLQNDGIDALGRWMKMKEDEVKMWKAEKAAADRKLKSAQNTVDFIKGKVAEVMGTTGMDKAKGSYYSFTPYTSSKTEVDKDLLKEYFQDEVENAVRTFLPADVTITLGASVSKLEEGAELPSWYHLTETPTVRFTKPRSSKEDK